MRFCNQKVIKKLLKNKNFYGIKLNIKRQRGGIILKNGIKTLAMWLIIGVIFIVLLSSILTNTNTKLKYSDLITKINEGKVEAIVIDADGSSATVTLSDDKIKKQVNIPNMESFMNYTEDFIKNGAFTLEENSESVF